MSERPTHAWDDPDGDGHNCVTCVAEGDAAFRCDKWAHPAWVIYGEKHTRLYCRVHKHFIAVFPCPLMVHDHPPYRPQCNERRLPSGQLRGACLNDDGTPTTPHATPGAETGD